LLVARENVPDGVSSVDLGCWVSVQQSVIYAGKAESALDEDIDYGWGKARVFASKNLNRQSQQYWLYNFADL
jgi:hypothetical protein